MIKKICVASTVRYSSHTIPNKNIFNILSIFITHFKDKRDTKAVLHRRSCIKLWYEFVFLRAELLFMCET